MHVLSLSGTEGRPRGPPRVLSDASLTLRCPLPPSLRRPPRASRASRAPTPSVAPLPESWESRAWDTLVLARPPPRGVTSKHAVDAAWEEEEAPLLPDDFPRLIVNLTRVERDHFPRDGACEPRTVLQFVKEALETHFAALMDVLFEQRVCFHCTYGTSRARVDALHRAYPDDVFALLDYPATIEDVPLHAYLVPLSCRSRWKSVDYVIECLRHCSRDIRWKTSVKIEMEALAEQERAHFDANQRQLSDAIDELTRVRDSMRDRIEERSRRGEPVDGLAVLRRKLDEIDTRLMRLLDAFLKEPELDEEECAAACGTLRNQVTPGMNVLDSVVVMIFSRLPQAWSVHGTTRTTHEHVQMLVDTHLHILRLWKKDFGRLPPKRPRPAPDATEGDEEWTQEPRTQVTAQCAASPEIVDGRGSMDDRNREEDESVDDRTTRGEDDADGYGADFDSEESQSDEEDEDATVKQARVLETRDSSAADIVSTQRRRRRKRPKGSRTLPTDKVEEYESDCDRATAPFQPYACTGGVGLLRLAKENETLF
ncbi:hypothetical protein PsorP6_009454 [Peronosclerospora sorghi]|uniref:Uncharacterized protein n=1 Tax=Peronosclerospora sorghi TaxID=230839 RepID=A0ACC0VZA8_9STRA|nr:hypothetical protein PsorP6_009454 [Peronosclerospora sorghi]